MDESHVVIGATGALGSAIVRQLVEEGRRVRAVVRDQEVAQRLLPPSSDVVMGDATDMNALRTLCQEATVVYHCVNVPYYQWEAVMPRVTENVLAAAREAHAVLVFPGNVYGYGPLQGTQPAEDYPLAARSKKGRLRNSLEARLMKTDHLGEIHVTIPRFPDFYGPNVTNRLMAPIFKAALRRKRARWIGSLDAPHDLAFIDDAARASVLLGSQESAWGQVWHVPGAGPLTGRQFLQMIFESAGTTPRISTLTNRAIRLFGLFDVDARQMGELLYEFEEPLILDGGKFAREFPSFKYTFHQEAIRRTLEWFRKHP